MMPGDGGKPGWYRMNDTAPNSGRGMIYKMDFYMVLMDFCYKAWVNAEIANVTS